MSYRLHFDPAFSSGNTVDTATAGHPANAQGDGEAPRRSDGEAQSPSRAETLDYLIDLTVQLKALAHQAGLRRLGILLLLAEQEARQQLTRPAPKA